MVRDCRDSKRVKVLASCVVDTGLSLILDTTQPEVMPKCVEKASQTKRYCLSSTPKKEKN